MLSDYVDHATLSGLGARDWRPFYRSVANLSTLPPAVQARTLNELARTSPDIFYAVQVGARNLREAAKARGVAGLGDMGELDGFFSAIGKFLSGAAKFAGKAVAKVGKFVTPIVQGLAPVTADLVGAAIDAAGGNANVPGSSVLAQMPPMADAYAVLPEIVGGNTAASTSSSDQTMKWVLIGGAGLLALMVLNNRR